MSQEQKTTANNSANRFPYHIAVRFVLQLNWYQMYNNFNNKIIIILIERNNKNEKLRFDRKDVNDALEYFFFPSKRRSNVDYSI